MKDVVRTPYGLVRLRVLQALQSSFDTTVLLKSVDDLDGLWMQWKKELRDDLLGLHAMAHTVINDAPLTYPPSDESLAEMAASVAEQLQDYREVLEKTIAGIKQLASLRPD